MTPEGWAFDHAVWKENKGLVAAALTDNQWLTVASGYREVQLAESNMRDAIRAAGEDEPPLTSDMPQLVQHGYAGIDRGAQVLDDVSRWSPRSRSKLRLSRRRDISPRGRG